MQKNAESNYSFEHMLKVHRYGFNPHWPLSSQPCLSMLGKHFFSGEQLLLSALLLFYSL